MERVLSRCMTHSAVAFNLSPKRFALFGRPFKFNYGRTLCSSPENEFRSSPENEFRSSPEKVLRSPPDKELRSPPVQVVQSLALGFPYLPYTRLSDPFEQKRQPLRVQIPKGQPLLWVDFDDLPPPLVSPAVQIFSVEIHTNFEDDDNVDRPCEVYGSIRANEEKGCTFSLFKRGPANPEMILNQGNLSLIDSYRSFITCSLDATTKLDFYLKDKTRDVEIIKGQHILHSRSQEIEESCDKLMKAFIQGRHGFALVYYTIFQYAVVAYVTIEISKKYDAGCQFSDMYGSIIALYPNSREYCDREGDLKYMKTTLFSKQFDNPLRTGVGDHIELSRFVIVVPAYGSLNFEADLWDIHGPFARGSIEFMALGQGDIFESIEGEGGIISIKVTWKQTFSRLIKNKIPSTFHEVGCTEETSTSKCEDALSEPLISCDEEVGASTFDPFGSEYSSRSLSSVRGTDLVEVFSVCVAGITDKVSALCGVILENLGHDNQMYNRDMSDPEILSADKSFISLEGHSAFEAVMISMLLRLNDPVSGLEVCHGYVTWCPVRNEYLYNTRLCSLVRGKHGYAVVHYMIFGEACLAKVEITLFLENISDADIYGSVFARYNNYDYSSAYHRKYFQSRLFDKRQGESAQLKSHSKMPLLKSVVAVETESALIVEADLRAVCGGQLEDEALCGSTMFEIDLSKTCRKIIPGARYYIEVAVNFTNET